MNEENLTRPSIPPRWIVRAAWSIHRSLYRVTGGRFGLRRPTADRYGLMRLTATGRKSGTERSVMLAYVEDGSDIVTLAMNGWHDSDPAWWLNLQADPNARIVLPGVSRLVTGRIADGDERDRLWYLWKDLDGNIDVHARFRSTSTDVVVLEPRTEPLERNASAADRSSLSTASTIDAD